MGISGAGAFARRGRKRGDTAWQRGASVERIVGAWLDRIPDIEVLHDRRVPGSRMALDHLAVTPAGVFVVESQLSGGRLAPAAIRRAARPGEHAEPEHELEKNAARVCRQARAVTRLLAGAPVPVAPALCLVDVDGSDAARSFMLDGVWVGSPAALPDLVGHPGLLDREAMRTVAARLDTRLS